MKIVTTCLFVFMILGLAACENHMDIQDKVKGTPSKADTVMPHKFAPHHAMDSSHNENLPRVFKR
jgi:hypothetical protein